MNRILLILFITTIVILALLTALASSGASLANGIAQAASATALMTSHCISAFLVCMSMFVGISIGVGASTFFTARRQHKNQALSGSTGQNSSNPFLQTGYQPRLPVSSQSQPVIYLPPAAESESVEEDILFKDWGW